MILTGACIVDAVAKNEIIISPFKKQLVNPNSYNYRLGSSLKVFKKFVATRSIFTEIKIPKEGYVLDAKKLYLGHTLEILGSTKYAMSLIGRSSIGRLGLFLQVSANLGHTTSCHQWTLELYPIVPIRVYPGMIIGQISFWCNYGIVEGYNGKFGRYNTPQESLVSEHI